MGALQNREEGCAIPAPIAKALRRLPNPPKLSTFLNPIIDSKLHPIAEKDKKLYLIDNALHTSIELADALVLSIHKSIKYNLSRLLEGG